MEYRLNLMLIKKYFMPFTTFLFSMFSMPLSFYVMDRGSFSVHVYWNTIYSMFPIDTVQYLLS